MNEKEARPNILYAFADDWGRYASAYRPHEDANSINHLIETPNFDRIASEGALFTNAFVPAPSCTPCRSSVLSGRYFWQTGLGAILQGAHWDESIPSYPLILEQDGYHIGYTYKCWSPGDNMNAPYGGDRTRYESAGINFNQFSQTATKNMKDMTAEEAKKSLLDETRSNYRSFIDSVPSNKPFCYWWGPTNTHRSWERGSGKSLWNMDPEKLKGRLPDFLPDVEEVREDVNDYLGECIAFDQGLGVIIEELEKSGELDNTIIVVSGDHGIPEIPRAKCNLYDLGCEVALAIRWPQEIAAETISEDFVSVMNLASTFLEAGGQKPLLEMAPSLLPLVSKQRRNNGEDWDFVITGRERHVAEAREGYLPYPQRAIRCKDYLYIRNYEPDRWPMGHPDGADALKRQLSDTDNANLGEKHSAPKSNDLKTDTRAAFPDCDASPTKEWMINNRKKESVIPLYNLAFRKRPGEELFDLNVDPHYMNNVAYDLDYADIKETLSEKLHTVLVASNDPRVREKSPCKFELEPYAGTVPERQSFFRRN